MTPEFLVAEAEAHRVVEGFFQQLAGSGLRSIGFDCRPYAAVCIEGEEASASYLKLGIVVRSYIAEVCFWLRVPCVHGVLSRKTAGRVEVH